MQISRLVADLIPRCYQAVVQKAIVTKRILLHVAEFFAQFPVPGIIPKVRITWGRSFTYILSMFLYNTRTTNGWLGAAFPHAK